MRAVAFEAFGGPEVLKLMDLPVPEPGLGEVRIRVAAAAINPVDYKTREGYLKDRFPHQFPVILGWDVAGTVDAAGKGADLAEGDPVYAYARTDHVGHGAYAEYLVLPAAQVARKPASLSMVEASAVPLAGLTAYQSLFDRGLHLKAGESVLIHAAAGGVGGYAVQLAKIAGADVLGTASQENHEYLRELGADVCIDYVARPFEEVVREERPDGICCAFDTVGGEVTDRTAAILPDGGRLVSIAKGIKAEDYPRLQATYVFVDPSREQLELLADHFDAGRMVVPPITEFPLEQAAEAHQLLETRHVRGKVVLRVE